MRARSREKVLKYDKYAIPSNLFHPITVGRTNVLSVDAANFIDTVGKFFPLIPKAADKIKAAVSRAIVVGAARTLNTAIRRAQLAAFNNISFSSVPKSAACRLFNPMQRSAFSSSSVPLGLAGPTSLVRRTSDVFPLPSGLPLDDDCILTDSQLSLGGGAVGGSWR
jgi:hypothetical protein